jgi:hypothetical protein
MAKMAMPNAAVVCTEELRLARSKGKQERVEAWSLFSGVHLYAEGNPSIVRLGERVS